MNNPWAIQCQMVVCAGDNTPTTTIQSTDEELLHHWNLKAPFPGQDGMSVCSIIKGPNSPIHALLLIILLLAVIKHNTKTEVLSIDNLCPVLVANKLH